MIQVETPAEEPAQASGISPIEPGQWAKYAEIYDAYFLGEDQRLPLDFMFARPILQMADLDQNGVPELIVYHGVATAMMISPGTGQYRRMRATASFRRLGRSSPTRIRRSSATARMLRWMCACCRLTRLMARSARGGTRKLERRSGCSAVITTKPSTSTAFRATAAGNTGALQTKMGKSSPF